MIPVQTFVAMFDFLGFKQLREACGTAGLHRLYQKSLLPHIQHAAAMKGKIVEVAGEKRYVPDVNVLSVGYQIVSDSILLFAHGDEFDHFLRIVTAAHQLLSAGFAGHKAPLRGAIGYGDLIFDPDSIWIGSAIEDAYAGESVQVWSGCALTSACQRFAESRGYINRCKQVFDALGNADAALAAKRIIKYAIPEQYNPKDGAVRYSVRDGFALDWTIKMYEGAGENAFAPTNHAHARQIIENTKSFEAWARANNR